MAFVFWIPETKIVPFVKVDGAERINFLSRNHDRPGPPLTCTHVRYPASSLLTWNLDGVELDRLFRYTLYQKGDRACLLDEYREEFNSSLLCMRNATGHSVPSHIPQYRPYASYILDQDCQSYLISSLPCGDHIRTEVDKREAEPCCQRVIFQLSP